MNTIGVTALNIYRVPGTDNLVMSIQTAGNVDLPKATGPGSKYREVARCKEWENFMENDFHGGWTQLTEVHSSDIEWNRALGLPSTQEDQIIAH